MKKATCIWKPCHWAFNLPNQCLSIKNHSTLVTQMWVLSLSPQLFSYKQPATHRIPIFISDKRYLKWIFFNSTELKAEEDEAGEFIGREEWEAIEKMLTTMQILHAINATCWVSSAPRTAHAGVWCCPVRGSYWARSFHAHPKVLGNLVTLSVLFIVN